MGDHDLIDPVDKELIEEMVDDMSENDPTPITKTEMFTSQNMKADLEPDVEMKSQERKIARRSQELVDLCIAKAGLEVRAPEFDIDAVRDLLHQVRSQWYDSTDRVTVFAHPSNVADLRNDRQFPLADPGGLSDSVQIDSSPVFSLTQIPTGTALAASERALAKPPQEMNVEGVSVTKAAEEVDLTDVLEQKMSHDVIVREPDRLAVLTTGWAEDEC